jgi:tetratricopeptide (TPR) repeat protein
MVSMQNRNWIEAEQRLKRALTLAGPDDYAGNLQYAWFLMNVGRASEAVPYEERAMRAEPALMRPVALRAALYEMQGDLDSARELLLNSAPLQENAALRRQGLFMVRMASQDRCDPSAEGSADGLPCPLLADPRQTLEDIRGIYQAARTSGRTGQLFAQAHFAAFLGDPQLALDMLDLWSNATTQNLHVIWRPVMRDVRALPGFRDLVRKLGLVDYWRAIGHWGDFCRPVGKESFTCSEAVVAADQ